MVRRCSRRAAAVSALVVVLGTGQMRAQTLPPDEPQTAVSGAVASSGSAAASTAKQDTSEQQRLSRPGSWPRLHVPDPVGRRAAEKALDEAWQLLAQRDCVALLAGFRDSSGRPLEEYLESLSVDPQTYLTLVVFVDGSREVSCVEGVFGFTTAGSRVVRLCIDELKRTWQKSPQYVTASFIHEMLHTLGLGENPPSSKEITQRVLAACHRHK